MAATTDLRLRCSSRRPRTGSLDVMGSPRVCRCRVVAGRGNRVFLGSVLVATSGLLPPATGTAPIRSLGSSAIDSYSPQRATFALRTPGVTSSYKIQTVSVVPGRRISLSVTRAAAGSEFALRADGGTIARSARNTWNWQATEGPGLHTLRVVRTDTPDTITVNVFVTVPRTELQGEYLNGYRIGRYPWPPRPIYRHPEGFIEITPENIDLPVSPHFQLRQFVCKQRSGYPKYVVLDPTLLTKLEIILEHVNAAGYSAGSFHVMSGYRTPYYNQAIGNVALSRHVWGAAADIFVDEDGDGYMDDLNGDGKRDISDVKVLYDIANQLANREDYQVFIGGLGTYRANSRHGPFLHVDLRGRRARWSH